MTSNFDRAGHFSLRRWSQRKLEAARADARTLPQSPLPPAYPAAAAQMPAGAANNALQPLDPTLPPSEAYLPPIESLTFDSDFAPFFKPEVDESIKRAALKHLFRDPRFNIMDGLDTYIDDYTQPDPIPSVMLVELMQRRVFFSPAAETNPAKHVVDEPAGDSVAPSAGAIVPPAVKVEPAPVVPAVPVASSDAVPDTADLDPDTGVDAKADHP